MEDLIRFYAAQELTLSKLLGEIDEIDFYVPEPVLLKLETAKGKQAHANAKSIIDVESKVCFMQSVSPGAKLVSPCFG